MSAFYSVSLLMCMRYMYVATTARIKSTTKQQQQKPGSSSTTNSTANQSQAHTHTHAHTKRVRQTVRRAASLSDDAIEFKLNAPIWWGRSNAARYTLPNKYTDENQTRMGKKMNEQMNEWTKNKNEKRSKRKSTKWVNKTQIKYTMWTVLIWRRNICIRI